MERDHSSPGRAINDGHVHPKDVVKLLADALSIIPFIRSLSSRIHSFNPKSSEATYTYSTNKDFWLDNIQGKHFPSTHINLEGFHLIEWIPTAPGRFFTEDARIHRRLAKEYYSYLPNGQRYLPLGKREMVLGGVGSQRLAQKEIDSYKVYFLGATSTGFSHQGIPIVLDEQAYQRVMPIIRGYAYNKAKWGLCY
ncbi:MAG: hypothetical protein M3Z04_09325 [Chloroflexota bacterium]|nr:hypothetical protein [Chloroflexota bacterium]